MLLLDWKDQGLLGSTCCPHLSGHLNTLKLHAEWVDLFLKKKLKGVTWTMSRKLLELASKALFNHPLVFSSLPGTSPIATPQPVRPVHSLFHLALNVRPTPFLLRLCLHHNYILRDPASTPHFLSCEFSKVYSLSQLFLVSSWMTPSW